MVPSSLYWTLLCFEYVTETKSYSFLLSNSPFLEMTYSGHSDRVVGLKIKTEISYTKEKETRGRVRTGIRSQVESSHFKPQILEYLNFSVVDSNLTKADGGQALR